jgi:hypothetical protein
MRQVERCDLSALLGRREQAIDEVALAGIGRQPPGRGVRVRQQPPPLEQ